MAKSSIDNANVVLDKGEMSFGMFDYAPDLDSVVLEDQGNIETLRKLQTRIGKEALPGFLIEYIKAILLEVAPDCLRFTQLRRSQAVGTPTRLLSRARRASWARVNLSLRSSQVLSTM